MVAAMGPRMLALSGRMTDGVILWLAGPRTIADTIAPGLCDAAAAAGRPSPRIVAGLPVCVTEDAARVRAMIDHVLGPFARFDSYRDVLAREGASGPGEVALVGTESDVLAGIDALAEAGATDFAATEFVTTPEETAATRATLRAALAAAGSAREAVAGAP
jgi:alkanesulfonate monooxygenase SsuD/methylene tetrahydromethanopterin reductase-like flavin-dependent oxidoreductase (luciferase family)